MESKYYTPDESEFHKGFEFELSTMRGWKSGAFPDLLLENNELDEFDDTYMKLAHAITRVKHLDQSDIGECGWKQILYKNLNTELPSRGINKCQITFERKYSDERQLYKLVHLILNSTNNHVLIAVGDNEAPHSDWETLFAGNIKNKSELKKIMQQSGIK